MVSKNITDSMRHDIVSDALNIIKTAEITGKKKCKVPFSNLVRDILIQMQKNKYIGRFEHIDDGKNGYFEVELLGRINDTKAIRPRFYVKVKDFIKWEKRFLPSVNHGLIIVSTSKGVMIHRDAKKLNVGGQLIGYVY